MSQLSWMNPVLLLVVGLVINHPVAAQIEQAGQGDHEHHSTQSSSTDSLAPSEDQDGVNKDAVDHSAMDHGAMNEGPMDNDGTVDHGAMDHGAMDHGTMDHGAMDHGTMDHGAMDHGTMDHGAMNKDPMENSTMDHGAMDHGAMDHGSMGQMQGGSAPANAREPHAYSGGFALDAGPYALPGKRQLRLADEHNFGTLFADRIETRTADGSGQTAYDLIGWYGRTYDKLVVKAEGELVSSKLESAKTDFLWGHAVSTFWDAQLGASIDSGEGPTRTWLAVGMQGLAPYWFELDTTFYVGQSGRTALRFQGDYELLLTQRWILQPRLEFNLYGKDDPELGRGRGLSNAEIGLRLRYEFSRKFAPYIGVEWAGTFGETADIARAAGKDASEVRVVAGLRAWF